VTSREAASDASLATERLEMTDGSLTVFPGL
jgi:hypothetical protein